MRRPLDVSLLIAGVLAVALVIGVIVLTFAGRQVPAVLETGVLAALGFFFSKGVGEVISNIASRPPPDPPGPTP